MKKAISSAIEKNPPAGSAKKSSGRVGKIRKPEYYVEMVPAGEGKYNVTGRSFSAPFAHVWNLRNGKVQRFRQDTDTAVVQRALKWMHGCRRGR